MVHPPSVFTQKIIRIFRQYIDKIKFRAIIIDSIMSIKES